MIFYETIYQYSRTPIIRTTWDRTRFGYADIRIIGYTAHVSQNCIMYVKNTPVIYKDMIFSDTLCTLLYIMYNVHVNKFNEHKVLTVQYKSSTRNHENLTVWASGR